MSVVTPKATGIATARAVAGQTKSRFPISQPSCVTRLATYCLFHCRRNHHQRLLMARWPAQTSMRATQILSWIALLAALAVYLNFGTLSPCGVLREASRQRDSLAAVLPDSIVDLSLAGQFGELSPGRCLAVLIGEPTLNNVQTSVPQTAQPVVPQTRNRRRYHQ